jgi:hypothetical protein
MTLSHESAVSGAIATQGECQTASLYQNKTSVHQMNQQTIQQIHPMYTSNANANQADILLQNNIPSCSNQDCDHHAATRTVTIMQQPGR